MDGTQAVRDVGNLTYKAQVLPGISTPRRFDGYALVLIRYRRDQNQQVVESHYWMLETAGPRWVEYDARKLEAINHTEVLWLDWPAIAYEIATHVQEAEARESLEGAIQEMVQREAASRGT